MINLFVILHEKIKTFNWIKPSKSPKPLQPIKPAKSHDAACAPLYRADCKPNHLADSYISFQDRIDLDYLGANVEPRIAHRYAGDAKLWPFEKLKSAKKSLPKVSLDSVYSQASIGELDRIRSIRETYVYDPH